MTEGLDQFLLDYPGMAICPSTGPGLVIRGQFAFSAISEGRPEITDENQLHLFDPPDLPRALPRVRETAGRIPRELDYHVFNTNDLCLGSPLRLLRLLAEAPTLPDYARLCLVRYLYAMSHKLKFGGAFVFGELAHGESGLLAEYGRLFGLVREQDVRTAMRLLGMKVRRANKLSCPCGCGRRVGVCRFNATLRRFRGLASRAWFRAHGLN